jgi:hypothetical protein
MWVVDGVSGRGHQEVCQGVWESVEETEGPDSGSGGRGDGLVARQRPSPAHRGGQAPAGCGAQCRNRPRNPLAPKYSYDTLKVLRRVWAASGGQCGKYLAASMALQLAGLERHGELEFGRNRYSPEVRAELLAMSAASIDRYLKPAQATDQISGVSMTKT